MMFPLEHGLTQQRVLLYWLLLIIRIYCLEAQIPTNQSSSYSGDGKEYSFGTRIGFEGDYNNSEALESDYASFYLAIRSGDVGGLKTVISECTVRDLPGRLDDLLSRAYEELRLKSIPITDEMEASVESIIIGLRFFSEDSIEDRGSCFRERVQLLAEAIARIRAEYSVAKVDQKFLFIAKFIARNIFILKHEFKSTYNIIPWEEMEYCLVRFISSHEFRHENNLFYQSILSKDKILRYLQDFIQKLQEAIDALNVDRANEIPNHGREIVTKNIIHDNPEFEDLYSDYKRIRDIDSLKKIYNDVQVASLADAAEREGQLIIIRVLQAIGEHLKNTLQSPKLSKTTSDLLLLEVPKSTKRILSNLRDSLSHSESFTRRMEIEADAGASFFSGVKSDINRIGDAISGILFKDRIRMIRQLLQKIIDSESDHEIIRIIETINNIEGNIGKTKGSFKTNELEELENLIQEANTRLDDKTIYERQLFNEIHEILDSERYKFKVVEDDYLLGLASLMSFSITIGGGQVDRNVIRTVKFGADRMLKTMRSTLVEQHKLRDIARLSANIFRSVDSRKRPDDFDTSLFFKIFYMTNFDLNSIKWIEGFRRKLSEKSSVDHGTRRTADKIQDKSHLRERISELRRFLAKNNLSDGSKISLRLYKDDAKSQAVVEMLLLDILSILEGFLANNLLSLDEHAPLLTGKCLRNHLAHDNAIIGILSDPATAIISNAQKFVKESPKRVMRKLGRCTIDDCDRLRSKFDQGLRAIVNQQRMFVALEEGNMEELKVCLRNGADLYSSDHSWSAVHFAAKGGNLEVMKLILIEGLDCKAKCSDGRGALHVAAGYGRNDIVEFLMREMNLDVNDRDNNGRTPLHLATRYGHTDTVEILLENGANINEEDIIGFTPMHYAARNNHLHAVKILLKREERANSKTCNGGFTLLHIASELGCLDLVDLLLDEGANPDCKTDSQATSIHLASLNGHTRVVEALISVGADINVASVSGCTALHFAVENGHEDIANALLLRGANVNVYDKTFRNTPLHYAAVYGHERIADALIRHRANINAATITGETALHLAAGKGHERIVDSLLRNGVNISVRDENGMTPLHYAVRGGREVVAKLLNNNAEVNARSHDGSTPLHLVAPVDEKEIAVLLVQKGALIEARDIKGNTPLYLSAGSVTSEVLAFLIDNGAGSNSRNHVGSSPLHNTAFSGNTGAASILIQKGASVNAIDNDGMTPLHGAIVKSDEKMVKLLINNHAQVNVKGIGGCTPLHLAVLSGSKEIVDILLANAADMDVRCKIRKTPLVYAIEGNHEGIVKSLIRNGVDINEEAGEPLWMAVACGYKTMVDLLIKNKADIKCSGLLHLAAVTNHGEILAMLIRAGADVDAVNADGASSLQIASQKGHKEIVDALLDSGADVNAACTDGTAVHLAAGKGHTDIIRSLIDARADLDRRDDKNRTAVELAAGNGHLQAMKTLLEYGNIHVDARYNYGFTLLHIASQNGNLEIVKFLVSEGSDIHAQNSLGSKSIHIAAREGRKDTVEFFIDIGLAVDEFNPRNQTPLHFAAMGGHLNVMEYLVSKRADVNANDKQLYRPLHIAAYCDQKAAAAFLLANGAVYNALNKMNLRPIDLTSDENIRRVFRLTEKLFEAAERNESTEIKGHVKAGACVNAKDAEGLTPLHYAVLKGHDRTADELLRNEADPNLLSGDLHTALHYAAKLSREKLVEKLLTHGAIHDAISGTAHGEIPLELAKNRAIIDLLSLINKSFEKLRIDDSRAINDLKKVKDTSKRRAIMNARNRDGETLVVAAIHNNFKEIDRLKGLYQKDASGRIDLAHTLLQNQGTCREALGVFESLFEERKSIFGLNNPATLEMQTYMAYALYKSGEYDKSLSMLRETLGAQSRIIGIDSRDALETRSTIAQVLHRQEKNDEAFTIYQEVYPKQRGILGPRHPDTVKTETNMVLVLQRLGRYEEALSIQQALLNRYRITRGDNDPATISAQNNMAFVLSGQGEFDKALVIFEEVREKKKRILGTSHPDTLRTMDNIAGVLLAQNKFDESLKAHREVSEYQKKRLGADHPDTLVTDHRIAHILFLQRKWFSALKALDEFIRLSRGVLEFNHPSVISALDDMRVIHKLFELQGHDVSDVLEHLQGAIYVAISNGDIPGTRRLLEEGVDINGKDTDGRTPLHYAVNKENIGIINLLLGKGADVTEVTNKGNTPLHTAVLKGNKEIVEILLTHDKSSTFINAVTIASGKTALHVAAEKGRLKIVESLLERGAIYDIENENRKTPIDLSKDRDITNLLRRIDQFFNKVRSGRMEVISELRNLDCEEFTAVTNARDCGEHTLLQVALSSGHKDIARDLAHMLKERT